MTKPMLMTANDTFPTTLTFSSTDPLTGVKTMTDLDGYTIELEVGYATPLVKTAVPLDPPVLGQVNIPWVAGDLVEGEWEAKLAVTNALDQRLSSEFLKLTIERDLTPPVIP